MWSKGFHWNSTPWDLIHFLKIEFVVAGGRFYSYYDHLRINLDKERTIYNFFFMGTYIRNKHIFKELFEFQIGFNSTATLLNIYSLNILPPKN